MIGNAGDTYGGKEGDGKKKEYQYHIVPKKSRTYGKRTVVES